LIIFVAVVEFNTKPVLVMHFIHSEALKVDHLKRRPPLFVGRCYNQHIINQHDVNLPDLPLQHHLTRECAFYLALVVGLVIIIAPNVNMKAGVVVFKQFFMRIDPLRKLLVRKSI